MSEIIDNINNTVLKELKAAIKSHSKLSIVSATFSIYAYEALKKELSKVDECNFILKNYAYNNSYKQSKEFYLDNNSLNGDKVDIKLRNEIKQSAIAKDCANWISKNVSFRTCKNGTIAYEMIGIESDKKTAILNASFDTEGLGINKTSVSNIIIKCSDSESSQLFSNFNQDWNNTSNMIDITDKLLEDINVLYKENDPNFLYYITLYNIFYNYLDELTEEKIVKTGTGFKDSTIWNKLYKFQKDGVIGVIDKIEKYNGCILADSVGLGKTYSALAVIKYYQLRNDRILVLTPKKLKENWTIYTLNDKRNLFFKDRFNYDVINHTDLSRTSGKSGDINLKTINWGNYDLVVIDESHNFRNNVASNDRVTRYQRLMKNIIKAGVKTKVLMLSATPVNNKMNDIKNQIAFITEGNDKALVNYGIKSISNTLKNAQSIFNKWNSYSDEKRTSKEFVEMMNLDYFKLLDTYTIARSRKHIEKYYNIKEIGEFPKRLKPINKYSKIDITNVFPSISEVNSEIKKLSLAIYSPTKFILSSKRKAYSDKYDTVAKNGKSIFTQADREQSLVNLMRINILKRMESSIHSFTITIKRIIDSIDCVLDKIDNLNEKVLDINIEDIDVDNSYLEDLLVGDKVKILLSDMDLLKWKNELEIDKKRLQNIYDKAILVSPEKDAKLEDLKKLIINKFKNPINENNKKIIIFTTFADTAEYLYNNLASKLLKFNEYAALVTGSTTNKCTLPLSKAESKFVKLNDINTILTLFSPESKACKAIFPNIDKYIDVIIATDCISEGQNLQDCDYLINYDIHWNPVRIIQRFGRIDRIGSKNKAVQLVNFWPMKDLDEYINLERKVQGKMVMLDVSATGEENIISDSGPNMKDLQYRKKQLQQLQAEVVDLEDISGNISITDLTFSDYKIDLMNYLKCNKDKLEKAPLGLYALAKIPDDLANELEEGVIFVLKQVDDSKHVRDNNSLYPYYLVYIDNNKKVVKNYLESKGILDIIKKICKDNINVNKNLVKIFNKETLEGKNMDFYTDLLNIALASIVNKEEEIGVASLFSKGGTIETKKDIKVLEDFELVDMLILKK